MRKSLINSTTALAVLAFLSPAVQAQTAATTSDAATPQATAPAAPQPTAPESQTVTDQATPASPAASASLPAALTDLGIIEATVTEGKRGSQRVRGTLPNGAGFMGMLDRDGQLRGLRVTDDGTMPDDILARLVPQAVRDAPTFAEIATVTAVMLGQDALMVGGTDAEGQPVRAAYATDGTLQRFGRGEMNRSGKDRHGMREHRRDDRDGGKRDGYGDRGKGDKDDRYGQRMRDDDRDDDDDDDDDDDRRERRMDERRDGGGMNGQGPGRGAARDAAPGRPAPLDDEAARAALGAAGYSQPGDIRQEGGRTLIDAVNPSGENVTVELNPMGAVIRETAR